MGLADCDAGGYREPFSEPRRALGQISAGSQTETRLGRASVLHSWEHGRARLPLWALDSAP